MARFTSLHAWLDWQSGLHPNAIDLGLERVQAVARRMEIAPACPVITVAGTNGKGSTLAFLTHMLEASGKRVGRYTSPHILHYRERIHLNGRDATDEQICDAFAAVDAARGDTSLTYFEFGTLAAFYLFQQQTLDVWLLEVGLGGRLDAVNILDPDVAIITSIDLDHQDWLGDNREAIAVEKAGIARPGRPVIIGDRSPPAGLEARLTALGARPSWAGRDFDWSDGEPPWSLRLPDRVFDKLPEPALRGRHQRGNLATAAAALAAGPFAKLLNEALVGDAALGARLMGRYQTMRTAGGLPVIVDVGHNPQAAQGLAEALRSDRPPGETWGVFACMARKDAVGIIRGMADAVDHWCVLSLGDRDAYSPESLTAYIRQVTGKPVALVGDMGSLAGELDKRLTVSDRIVAFGSFRVAEEATRVWAGYNAASD